MVLPLRIAALLLVAASAAAAADTRYLQGMGDVRYHYVESEHVGRGYHVFVSLPDGYEATTVRRYPAVYLLDGGMLFPLLASYYRYLNFSDEIPETIVVGISYGSASFEGGNYRGTDYTAPSEEREYWGGAPRFQQFLSEELLPMVEETYRAAADRRIVFGQSLGGQFVLYTAQTRPDLFWGHIASNPALHRNLSFFLQSHVGGDDARSNLFVASAVNDDPVFREPAVEWMKHWTARPATPWALEAVDLPGHDHMSAAPESFRRGMRWLFRERSKREPAGS